MSTPTMTAAQDHARRRQQFIILLCRASMQLTPRSARELLGCALVNLEDGKLLDQVRGAVFELTDFPGTIGRIAAMKLPDAAGSQNSRLRSGTNS